MSARRRLRNGFRRIRLHSPVRLGSNDLYFEVWEHKTHSDPIARLAHRVNNKVAKEIFDRLHDLKEAEKLFSERSVTSLAVFGSPLGVSVICSTDFGEYFAWYLIGGYHSSFHRLTACCEAPSLTAKEAAIGERCARCRGSFIGMGGTVICVEDMSSAVAIDVMRKAAVAWCEEAIGDPLEAIVRATDLNTISEMLTDHYPTMASLGHNNLLDAFTYICRTPFSLPL